MTSDLAKALQEAEAAKAAENPSIEATQGFKPVGGRATWRGPGVAAKERETSNGLNAYGARIDGGDGR